MLLLHHSILQVNTNNCHKLNRNKNSGYFLIPIIIIKILVLMKFMENFIIITIIIIILENYLILVNLRHFLLIFIYSILIM